MLRIKPDTAVVAGTPGNVIQIMNAAPFFYFISDSEMIGDKSGNGDLKHPLFSVETEQKCSEILFYT